MPNKMLIDASHQEETRVVVVRGNRIEEFDFESQDKKQLKGNIYLARVTRVEPSLQAAFVEYGGNRHGFLAFSEIHPDYYQIPVADRQAILKAEAEAVQAQEDEEDEDRSSKRRRGGRSRQRGSARSEAASETDASSERNEADGEASAASIEGETVSEPAPTPGDEEANGSQAEDAEVDTVGAEDAIEEARDRRRPVRRQYKIQEVIKRRQILLVQVVKEERGNKGAALTTYMSLAGRYSVLMPNTARGGGISRKITNALDRKRLKDVVKELEVPQGMGVILRTAGESRTKAEIKRDYEYLMRLWENVRNLTLQSSAPALVYEEGSLIKRSVRDLYNKDIDQILVSGDEGYREAKDFMRMLMPSHAKVVQPYRETVPIFMKHGVEAQLDKMLQPQVTLKSGGYIIINQTEALVAIDVNSGRSTREHSIEDTALQTNLEAAEEVARQLRLRDLAGLIVIDFIDMEENRNNRSVEKKVKDCLKNDRARIQVGRISHFGLLEMSRQRIRASVLDSTTQPCPHCGGTGHVRSESSVALLVVRAIEEYLLKEHRHHITVRTPGSTAFYILNHKRRNLADLEARFGLTITVEADENVGSSHYAISKGAIAENEDIQPALVIEPPALEMDEIEEEEDFDDTAVAAEESEPEGGDDQPRRKRRRRRRRGGRDRGAEGAGNDERSHVAEAAGDLDDEEATPGARHEGADPEAIVAVENLGDAESEPGSASDDAGSKRRRRGKRGGRRSRRDGDAEAAQAADQNGDPSAIARSEIEGTPVTIDPTEEVAPDFSSSGDEGTADAQDAQPTEAVAPTDEPVATEEEPAKKPARRSRAKVKPVEAAEPDMADAETAAEEKKPARRKRTSRKAEPKAEDDAQATPGEEAASPANGTIEQPAPAPEPAHEEAAAGSDQPATDEPVASSTAAEAEPDDQDNDRPRKTGWWQRRSFF